MQRKPFRRLTAGRLAVHRYYRLRSEAANQQYLTACIPPPILLESTTEQEEEAVLLNKGLVQLQQLQVALCAQQTLKELKQRSLTAFCSKENLLKLRHSMQPQMLPLLVLTTGGSLSTKQAAENPSTPRSLDHILELETPMLAKVLHTSFTHLRTSFTLHLGKRPGNS